jgi:hypothetical protein
MVIYSYRHVPIGAIDYFLGFFRLVEFCSGTDAVLVFPSFRWLLVRLFELWLLAEHKRLFPIL